ncbi:MAG: hypothetical protein KDD74_06440 [Anaerolineales bacterium]|nr:hypothetical protein [Anaerolineales bacterium]
MFRIGIIELGVTCALISLAIIIPLVITRGYARLNKRLKSLENKTEKKK